MPDGTTKDDWQTMASAIDAAGRSRRTINRWISAGYVRKAKVRGRLLLRASDVLDTERALFDGLTPPKRHAEQVIN